MSEWREVREGIWRNDETGAYVLDGRTLDCPSCLRGRLDYRSIHRTLGVRRVLDYGHDTNFGTAKALSVLGKDPRDVVLFWQPGELIDLAKI